MRVTHDAPTNGPSEDAIYALDRGDRVLPTYSGYRVVSRSIEHRMRSFVAWHRQVPPTATRVEDSGARVHAASWLRRTIGHGVAASHVIGFELQYRWWTFFFERASSTDAPEPWCIEAYAHDGKSWKGRFLYWPEEDKWRHELYLEHGDDYGRFPDASAKADPGT